MNHEKLMEIKTLQVVKNFSEELQSTSSSNEKKVIIEKFKSNKYLCKVLNYTYSPYIHFGVSSKNCKKLNHICDTDDCYELFDLLDDLNENRLTGHDAIGAVNAFVAARPEFEDIIFNIIDKDLKTRAGATLINKVIPGLIPQFKVALAEAIKDLPDFENEEWLASRKLDGVRCVIRKEQDEITAYSRQGNEFYTLEKVLNEVSKLPGDFVLDGEVCIVDENGNENFQDVMKEIRRKNHTIVNPKYFVFDMLTLQEFDEQKGDVELFHRYEDSLFVNHYCNNDIVTPLEQDFVPNEKYFHHLNNEAIELGHEGIMIRKNTGYKGKRSKDILKVKQMHDAEYVVQSCDFDKHRVIRDGKEVVMPMLAQIYITHKGNEVAVGSGFTQEQRIRYQKYPNEIIGKTVTVQYFEESQNKSGLYSLRFPVLKHIYEGERNC